VKFEDKRSRTSVAETLDLSRLKKVTDRRKMSFIALAGPQLNKLVQDVTPPLFDMSVSISSPFFVQFDRAPNRSAFAYDHKIARGTLYSLSRRQKLDGPTVGVLLFVAVIWERFCSSLVRQAAVSDALRGGELHGNVSCTIGSHL